MIRTVLIDDEIDSIRVLQRLLEGYCPEVCIVGKADGVEMGVHTIQSTKPDLVFLDIEMTHGNAFDLLNQLQPIGFQVIFVTAFDNYAIRAFKYSAVDYLLKPIDIDDLQASLGRVMQRVQGKTFLDQMETLLYNVETFQLTQQKMAVPTLTGLVFIPIKDIMRFEAKGSYTTIFLTNTEQIIATRNIKEYEDLLPAAIFCRVHNSHIINLHKIQKYHKGRGGYVVMEDGTNIEVASRRREEFLQRLLK
ncbi:MAG TPA: LytTR family DNA-binding domain-containing protein [Puia sp.]|jgi:two-component system LytT family response regulator|nr:LytTR family DNA-binding domain-containing protein [Puia sp.]